MDGDSTSSGGHSHTGAQSKSDGHSTLNENSTDASSGSKPAGGPPRAPHPPFTGLRSPPAISTFDVPSPAAGFSSRTNSVRWRRSFDGASESETSRDSIPLRTPAAFTARRRRSSQH